MRKCKIKVEIDTGLPRMNEKVVLQKEILKA